jgi:dipeptidyl aminopeptidase/acylaminoacyl peptidase
MFTLRTRIKKEIVSEFLPPKTRSNKVIVLCGGLPGYPSRHDLMFALAKKGWWVFMPRYRGTWESGGKLFAQSPHQDILDLIDQLPKGFRDLWSGKIHKIRNPKVYLVGSSFGGPAVLLASKDARVKKSLALSPVVDWRAESRSEPISKLKSFVESAFGDGYRVDPKGWDKIKSGKFYNPATALDSIDGQKIMIIHAKDDEVVAFSPAQKFADEVGAKFLSLRRGGHLGIGLIENPKFWKITRKFFEGR